MLSTSLFGLLPFVGIALAAQSATPAEYSGSSGTSAASNAASTSEPGYFTDFTTVPGNNLTFGQRYAVLNLDMINGLVGSVNTTEAGQTWINSVSTWIDAVHSQNPPPISIFTRIFFSNTHKPEVSSKTPFAQAVAALGPAVSSSPQSQIYPAFNVLDDYDVVLQKTRYEATYGNQLVEILRAQQIDTVVLSGIRTSGVILSTTYRLFDENFNVYVISNNTIETPPDTAGIDRAIKAGIIPKLPANVITLEQALAALGRSGSVGYLD